MKLSCFTKKELNSLYIKPRVFQKTSTITIKKTKLIVSKMDKYQQVLIKIKKKCDLYDFKINRLITKFNLTNATLDPSLHKIKNEINILFKLKRTLEIEINKLALKELKDPQINKLIKKSSSLQKLLISP